MTTGAQPPNKGYRTIRLPLAESAYARFLPDRSSAEDRLEELYAECADLFPDTFPWGDTFFGLTEPSLPQHLRCRRLRLEQGRPVFPIAPAFGRPSRTGRPQDVDHAWFWRRFPVPWWAMAHVLGRKAMYGYRLAQGLGRCRVVGTTGKSPKRFPTDRVAEEQPSWWPGERVDIATTAAHDGLLGASVAPSASQAAGDKASGVCASDAQVLEAEYAPETVKTEGWQATPGAGKALCTHLTVSLGLLQAFLKIRARATQAWGESFAQVQKRGWEASNAPSNRAFSQRLRRLRAWAETAFPDGRMKNQTLDVCGKRDQVNKSYDHPGAHRTSKMVDRLRKWLDRAFFKAQYFHGTPDAAESRVRA